MMTPRAVANFWAKVNKDGPIIREEIGPCWVWTGSISSTGYGSVWVGGKGYTAHAISFYMANGRFIAKGLETRHKNRACVRPDHLLEGARKQNARDCIARGRRWNGPRLKGEDHFNGKKTHCPYGHEYTPENTYIINRGQSRSCKTCTLRRAKEFKAKRREQCTTT